MKGDKELFEDEFKQAYEHYKTSYTINQHHFYLSNEIDEPSVYSKMIHTIRTSTCEDEIHIHLNTMGGRIDTTIQLIAVMKNTLAKVVTYLEGEVCSAGTLLFLSGSEFVVYDNCLFMAHNYSGGSFGKGNEQKSQIDATNKQYKDLCKDLYKKFMTQKEITDMLNGKDFWFTSEQVRKRLKKITIQEEDNG